MRLDAEIDGEIWVFSIAVKTGLVAQPLPARIPAGHEEQPFPALPNSLPGQQCAAAAVPVAAAANAKSGPWRPIANTTISAMYRRLIMSVYTPGDAQNQCMYVRSGRILGVPELKCSLPVFSEINWLSEGYHLSSSSGFPPSRRMSANNLTPHISSLAS